MRRASFFVPVLALLAACQTDRSTNPNTGDDRRKADLIDVNTGSLKIEPRYDGQTLDLLNAGYELSVFVDGAERGFLGYYNVGGHIASLTLNGLSVGIHSVELRTTAIGVVVPAHDVTIGQSTTTTDDAELSAFMGIITGSLLVNGAPPTDDAYAVCASPASFCNNQYRLAAGSTQFRIVTAAGARTGGISKSGVGVVQSFAYAAIAGQENDLGVLAVTTGSLKVEPLYNGQTLDLLNAGYELNVFVDGAFRGFLGFFNAGVPSASLTLNDLSAGVHSVELQTTAIGVVLPAHDVTVAQGATTTDNVELSTQAGIISGNILINGAPPADNSYAVCASPATFCNNQYVVSAGTSQFRILTAAGARDGGVSRAGVGRIQSFAYTAVAGQEVDVGTIAFNTGSLTVQPRYLGQALDLLNAGYELTVYVDGAERGFLGYFNIGAHTPSLTLNELSVGVHSVELRTTAIGVVVSAHDVTVVSGQTAMDNTELAPFMGIITGTLFVNGAPPADDSYAVCATPAAFCNNQFRLNPGNGQFRILTAAGSRSGGIYRTAVGVLQSFSYTAVAGQESAVGNIGDPPSVQTPSSTSIWLGLKNSDDVGTFFDLQVELLRNGVQFASGQLNGVAGGSSGFNNAVQRTIDATVADAYSFGPGDVLGVRVSARIAVGVSGHRSGTARLWYNDASANSRVTLAVNGVNKTYYFLFESQLGVVAGTGPRKSADVFVDRLVGGNPFKPIGTWQVTY